MKKRLVAAIYARKSVILQKGDTLNIQEKKCRKVLKCQYDDDEYDLSIKCYVRRHIVGGANRALF